MADQSIADKNISNLHMEHYFPKDTFSKLSDRNNLTSYHSKAMEKYFESVARENVERCGKSTVKAWITNNLPNDDRFEPQPSHRLNLANTNCLGFNYNKTISDYTRSAYNRTEQLKKLQEAYSLLRQKLQEKRRACCYKEASEAEAAALVTQRSIASIKNEDKDKIATGLLLENAEELGIPLQDLELLKDFPFNKALKSIIDTISTIVNNKFNANLKERCESARRKAGAEYRDEIERIKMDLETYKSKSKNLESTISMLNSKSEDGEHDAEKIKELQKSLEESNKKIDQLKDSLYEMAKENEELEKNEAKLEESLLELEKYKLESEKLASVIKDLELLNQQKQDNEELIKMLQDELEQYKSKSLQLNAKIENLENLNDRIEPLNSELTQAYEKLSELESSLKQVEGERCEANKKLEYSRDEIEKQKLYSTELEQSISKLKDALADMESETKDQVNDLQTCLNEANNKVESLENTILQLKQLNAELGNSENKVQELQSKLTESNNTITELEQTITELESLNTKYNDYDEKMDDLQNQLKEYAEKIIVLEQNTSEFDYKGQVEFLNKELEMAQLKIKELESAKENNGNVENVASPRKDYQVEGIKLEMAQLEEMVKNLQSEKDELENQSREFNATLEEYKEQISSLQSEKDELENQSREFNATLEEYKEQISSLQSEKDELENQSREFNATLEEYKEQISSLQNEKDELENQSREFNATLEEYKEQISSLQNEKDELEKKLNEFNGEIVNDLKPLPINPSQDPDLNKVPNELEIDKDQLYSKKSSRKTKKKSHRDGETARSEISLKSSSRHSKKDKHQHTSVDNKSTDEETSDAGNELRQSISSELITNHLDMVKQSTNQLTELGYDSISNVGSYLSDYIFGSG